MKSKIAACLVALILPLSGAAFAETTLKVSHQYPGKDTEYRHRQAQIFAEELQKANVGLAVTIYPDQTLMKAREQWDALIAGSLDVSFFSPSDIADKPVELQLFGLPMLIKDKEHAKRLSSSKAGETTKEEVRKTGVIFLEDRWIPMHLGAAVACPQKPADIVGQAVRAPSRPMEQMLEVAGAVPVSMPSSELSKAVATGALDIVLTSTFNITNFGLDKSLKCMVVGGHGTFGAIYNAVAISTKSWAMLTPEQQSAVAAAAKKASDYAIETADKMENDGLEKIKASGVAFQPLSQEAYEEWRALAEKTAWANYAKQSPLAKQLLDEAKAID